MKIGNRVTEKDIRLWLDNHGFESRAAIITELELHAIQRPGWVQVFRFRLRVKSLPNSAGSKLQNGEIEEVRIDRMGVVLDDERIRNQKQKTQIWIFENELEYRTKLESVSSGMLTCRPGQTGNPVGVLLGLLVLLGIALSSTILLNLLGNK